MCKLELSLTPHIRADQSDTRMRESFGRATHRVPKGFYAKRINEDGETYHERNKRHGVATRYRKDAR